MPGRLWDLELIVRLQHGIVLLLPVFFVFFSLSPDRGFTSVSGIGELVLLVLGGIGIIYLGFGRTGDELVGLFESIGSSIVPGPQGYFFPSWNLTFLQFLLVFLGFLILLLAALLRRRNSGWLAPWPVILLSFVAGMSRMIQVPILLYWVLSGVGFVQVILLHEAWREAFFDPLTGIGNARALQFRLKRSPGVYTSGEAWIENFDDFCASYGDATGQQCIRMVGSYLSRYRSAFRLYRLDGPRFVLLRKTDDSQDVKKLNEEVQKITQGFANRGFRLRKTRKTVEVNLGLAWGGELYLGQEYKNL